MMEEIKRFDGFELMADFVEKYEIMQPFLDEGELDVAIAPMGDLCMRFSALEGQSVSYPHPQLYAAYRMALTYMQGIFKAHRDGEKVSKSVFSCLDRLVSEVDIGMQGLFGEKWRDRLGRAN
jgi:hypothetical protein